MKARLTETHPPVECRCGRSPRRRLPARRAARAPALPGAPPPHPAVLTVATRTSGGDRPKLGHGCRISGANRAREVTFLMSLNSDSCLRASATDGCYEPAWTAPRLQLRRRRSSGGTSLPPEDGRLPQPRPLLPRSSAARSRTSGCGSRAAASLMNGVAGCPEAAQERLRPIVAAVAGQRADRPLDQIRIRLQRGILAHRDLRGRQAVRPAPVVEVDHRQQVRRVGVVGLLRRAAG